MHFFVTIRSTLKIGSVVVVVVDVVVGVVDVIVVGVVVIVVDDRNGETSVTTLAKPTV